MRRTELLEECTLAYSEFVLFVDHGEHKFLESDSLLQQGVSTNDDVDESLLKFFLELIFLRLAD